MPIEYGTNYVEKRLSSRDRHEPQAIADLRSEAALLSRLSTLRVTPRFIESGEDALGPWHRIERIALPMLATRLTTMPLDTPWIERAVRVTFAALAGLHEATDSAGPLAIVHGDLSPANIAIEPDASRALLLDLNLAWWRDGPRRDGSFRGTIAYVSPEIARGERPTPKSDLFSLAASLLHAMTGAPPRTGASFAALVAAAGETPVLTAEHAAFAVRGAGHAAVVACLAHAPEHRPASARAVLETLR